MAFGRTSNEWFSVISVPCFYSMPGRRASRALSTLVVRSDPSRTGWLFFLLSFFGFLSGNCSTLLLFDRVNLLILTIQTVLSSVLSKPYPSGRVLTRRLWNSKTFALLLLAVLLNLKIFPEILEAKHLFLCISLLTSSGFARAYALSLTKNKIAAEILVMEWKQSQFYFHQDQSPWIECLRSTRIFIYLKRLEIWKLHLWK